MIRTTIACGAVTTLAGVAGLLIREYIVYKGLSSRLKELCPKVRSLVVLDGPNFTHPMHNVYLYINYI